jgi:VWFA-related protein
MRRCILVLLATSAAAGAEPSASPPPSPKDLGLTERVQRRLVQIDVSLKGPADRLAGLGVDHFTLTVAGRMLKPVAVDPLCPGTAPALVEAGTGSPPEAAHTPTTYLFYFDQRNLTFVGRTRAAEQAKALIPRLVREGNRAAIVSSGKRMTTLSGFTERNDVLLEAIDRLHRDIGQWDDYAALEGSRQDDVVRAKRVSREAACQQARFYQRDELRRAEASLELFLAALGRFADVDAPKIALYFADTLRDEPGRHYIAEAGSNCFQFAGNLELSFRKLHQGAAAYGVKAYAVQAEGLVPPPVSGARVARETGMKDAQDGLKTLTLETGGNAFLNGASVESMVERMAADAACVYVLSFDPAPFPQDQPLSVRVDVAVPGVRARARTEIVVQSESARRMATLLAAFMAPDTLGDAVPMHAAVVPLDVDDGKLRLLVQASPPATTLAQGEEWDLGMSLVSQSTVPDDASGRVAVNRAGVRLVIESEMRVKPGPYEIALVGIESMTGRVATGRIAGNWSGALPEGVSATSILQPMEGAFLRDGRSRTTGSLVVADGEPVRADRPAAFVSLVCRTDKRQTTVRVLRSLTGPSSLTFTPLELALSDKPCAQVRDVVPPGTLAPGEFTYGIMLEGAKAGPKRDFHVE